MFENRKWVIVDTDDVTDEMLSASLNNGRKSVDETKSMLKWDGSTASCFNGIATYNHSEIKAIIDTEAWTLLVEP